MRRFVKIGRDTVLPVVVQGEALAFNNMISIIKEWVKDRYDRLYRVGLANAKTGALETADIRRVGNVQYRLWLMPMDATVTVLSRKDGGSPAPERASGDNVGGGYHGFNVTPQTLHILAEYINIEANQSGSAEG